jgi:hypothetical protein
VLDNPRPFLANRWNVFLGSNSFGTPAAAGLGAFDNPDYRHDPVAVKFMTTNFAGHPLSAQLKNRVSRLLLCFNGPRRFNGFGHLFWNAIIPIVLLSALSIYNLLRRRYFWAVLGGLVLAVVPILFLTSPGYYFMYFAPVYVTGYLLIALQIVAYIDRRRTPPRTLKHLTTRHI